MTDCGVTDVEECRPGTRTCVVCGEEASVSCHEGLWLLDCLHCGPYAATPVFLRKHHEIPRQVRRRLARYFARTRGEKSKLLSGLRVFDPTGRFKNYSVQWSIENIVETFGQDESSGD